MQTSNYVESTSITIEKNTECSFPTPKKFNNSSEEEQMLCINQYKYLLKDSSVKFQEKGSKYSLLEQYKTLYAKYHLEKRKTDCDPKTAKNNVPSGKMSIIDYICSSKIETLDLSFDELKRLSIALPELLDEVNIVLDIKEEEKKRLAEIEEQMQALKAQLYLLEGEHSKLQRVA